MDKKKLKSKLIAGGLIVSFLAYTSPVLAYTRDETVYSKIDSKGETYQTIISSLAEDGIYYEGETQKELPITCKIKYSLDGKEISAEELAGKNGKVTIEITYTNHEKHTVAVNGTNTTLYTPFFVLTGAIVNNENNKNITVSKGKVIKEGNKTVVVGMTMPGMQKSLGIGEEKFSLPDSVKITMDATNFELGNIFTIATPRILEEDDKELFDKIDEIYSKVTTLEESSNKIEKGANDLKKGTSTYYEKSKEFNKAMNQVQKGANTASTEYSKINQGISTLNSNSGTLNSGAKQVNDGMAAMKKGLTTISGQLSQVEAGATNIVAGAKQLQQGVTIAKQAATDVTTKVLTAKATLQATIQANQDIINTLKTQTGVDTTQLEANNAALEQSLQALNTLDMSNATNSLAILNGSLTQVKAGIDGDGTTQNPGLVAGTQTISQGISKLKKDGIDTLATKSSDLVAGTQKLYNGTQVLQQGTMALENGSNKIQTGLSSLQNGTTQLLNANNQLTKGAKTLQTGATSLEKGIHTFNTEGIKPICNYVNGDLRNLTNRAKKLVELSDEYQSFDDSKEEQNGDVKFIIMSDSIKSKKEEE